MKNQLFRVTTLVFLLLNLVPGKGRGQQNSVDSLELTPLINKVIQSYPTIQQAAEAVNAAELRIALARTSNLPAAMATGSFAHVGPVPTLTLPDVGSFSLAPRDNMNASVSINQTLSDFGKTRMNIAYEEKSKQLIAMGLDQVRQKLSLAVINCYYRLLYLQEAVSIKEQQLNTLSEHLGNVEKKTASGSATQYEILSTRVRISTVESQITDINTALDQQVTLLNLLVGEPATNRHRVRNILGSDLLPVADDSMIARALNNRNEIRMAEKKVVLSQAWQELVRKHENPVLSAFASGGWKNGYIPELAKPKANYAIGLSLHIPIYDASRTKINTQLAGSAILSNSYEAELTRRTITAEVMESINELKAAVSKSKLFELQLSQAKRALELAELKFKSGTLTNLDVLDSQNAESESRLQFLRAGIERVVISYKLKAALGVNLY